MTTPYTSGVWQVNEGNEEWFVAAWKDLAEWTVVPRSGSFAITFESV